MRNFISEYLPKRNGTIYLQNDLGLFLIAKNRREPDRREQIVLYPYSGLLLSNKKEGTIDPCCNMYFRSILLGKRS